MLTVNPEKIIKVAWLDEEKGLIKVYEKNCNKRRGSKIYLAYRPEKFNRSGILGKCDIICPFSEICYCTANSRTKPCCSIWNSNIYNKFCENNGIFRLLLCKNSTESLEKLMRYYKS